MQSFFRLDSVSPLLAATFRQASPAKRRRAAVVACELAAASAGLVDHEVIHAIDALRMGAAAEPSLQRRIEELAAQYDVEYLLLAGREDEPARSESLRLFSKARAASALAFTLSNESTQLHEAIYEAIEATSNPDELLRATAIELQ